jgi:hypothetical protein
MSETVKLGIVADLAGGTAVRTISERYNVAPSTIWRLRTKLQQSNPDCSLSGDATSTNLHRRIMAKSFAALEGALDCAADMYRRGLLGSQVLKESGAFTQFANANEVELAFIRRISGASADIQERYAAPSPEADPKTLSPQDHELWGLEAFRHSGFSASEFQNERTLARQGERRLISNNPEVEAFFAADAIRHFRELIFQQCVWYLRPKNSNEFRTPCRSHPHLGYPHFQASPSPSVPAILALISKSRQPDSR